jgi:hypothetical protein
MVRWLVLSLVLGCGDSPAPEVGNAPVGNPHPIDRSPAPAAANPHAAPSSTVGGRRGVVLETMNGGGYTYAKLDVCGTELWVAGPDAKLAVGNVVDTQGSMPMKDFHSSTLDLTFPSLLFVTAIGVTDQPVDCSKGTAVAPPHPMKAPVGAPVMAAGQRQGKVLETMESGGYRYAHVDFCGTQAWVAGPSSPLAVGQTVGTGSGMPMRDFHSSTLNRTFAAIDFVRELHPLEGEPSCN